MKKTITFILIVLLVISSFSCKKDKGVIVKSEDEFKPITLQFANQHPADSFMSKLDQEICDKISEVTEGRVNFKLYTDSSLGDYPSVFEEVMVGSIAMAHTSVPETYGTVMAASMCPYVGTDFETLRKAYRKDGYLYNTVSLAMSNVGIKTFGFFCEGFNGVGTDVEVNNPASVGVDKGVIVRIPALDTFSLPMKTLGFRTSTIAYADTYTAIQTGVVDGWHGGPPNLNYLYFRDVVKYYYYYMANQEATQIYINSELFNTFLKKDQEAITKVIEDALASTYDLAKNDDQKYMDLMASEGIQIIKFTDAERETIAQAIRTDVWPVLAKEMGTDFWKNFAADIGVNLSF